MKASAPEKQIVTLRRLLAASVTIEALTSVAVMLAPKVVARLLLGADLLPGGEALARLCGIALFSLCLACWPGPLTSDDAKAAALRGMLIYNAIVTLYLGYLLLRGWTAVLLVPAVAVHAVVSLLFVRIWFSSSPDRRLRRVMGSLSHRLFPKREPT